MKLEKSLTKTLLAGAAVLLLLLGLPFSLRLVQAQRENALFAKPHPLPLPGDELSPEAEDIPLVADLWSKAKYYDFTARESADYGTPAFRRGSKELAEIYEGLSLAGIIPAGAGPTSGRIEPLPEKRTVAVSFTRFGEALMHNDRVVNLWVRASAESMAEFNQSEACLSYIEYLGLDVLDDWQPAQISNTENLHSGALYSASAEIIVQVTADYRAWAGDVMIGITVSHMSRAAFAAQNIAGE